MFKRYAQKLIAITAAIGMLSALSLNVVGPSLVSAATNPKEAVCEGVALTGTTCTTTAGPSVEGTVVTVINLFSFFVGVAAVIMIIIGGFKYIIASGDSSNIKSAKDTILYALVGLGVVALAQVIVRFVVNNVSP